MQRLLKSNKFIPAHRKNSGEVVKWIELKTLTINEIIGEGSISNMVLQQDCIILVYMCSFVHTCSVVVEVSCFLFKCLEMETVHCMSDVKKKTGFIYLLLGVLP